MALPRWQARQLGIQARKLGSPRPKALVSDEPPKEVILMRVRETILHSERHPDGAATLQGRQHRSWPQANPNRSNQGQPSHPGYPGRQGIPGFGSLLQWQQAVTTRGGVRKGFAFFFFERETLSNPFPSRALPSLIQRALLFLLKKKEAKKIPKFAVIAWRPASLVATRAFFSPT